MNAVKTEDPLALRTILDIVHRRAKPVYILGISLNVTALHVREHVSCHTRHLHAGTETINENETIHLYNGRLLVPHRQPTA